MGPFFQKFDGFSKFFENVMVSKVFSASTTYGLTTNKWVKTGQVTHEKR